jgi:hypothetical protein
MPPVRSIEPHDAYRLLNWSETLNMASYVSSKGRPTSKHVSKDAMEYRLIFAVCFPVVLIATVAEKLVRNATVNWSSEKTFFVEVKDATHRCTSLAFTG